MNLYRMQEFTSEENYNTIAVDIGKHYIHTYYIM